MNLILFDTAETTAPLPRADPRAAHLLNVLRRREGDSFDAGLVNGPRGKGTLAAIGHDALTLNFSWGPAPPPPEPITLLIGLPRPQTARDILRDVTSLGVGALNFVTTEKSDPSYAQSTLWSSGEWRRHLLTGAAQAFETRLPSLTHGQTLRAAIAALPSSGVRLALDNYEASAPLSKYPLLAEKKSGAHVTLACGPERGWSTADREALRTSGFTLVQLGARVLRTETACIAALALVRAKLGLL